MLNIIVRKRLNKPDAKPSMVSSSAPKSIQSDRSTLKDQALI